MKNLSIIIAAVLALTTLLEFPSAASAQNLDEIYVFGDSLSDVGNVYEASRGNSPPSPPYFQGRYSNGPVWVEYLASKLKLTSNPDTNFAFGGAKTGNAQETSPGVLAQVQTFTATNSSANPNGVYVVWAGANDYLGGATDSTAPVNNLTTAVKSLAAAGAKKILVVNLPDLGKLAGTRNNERSNLLNNLTKQHNSKLTASLNSLRQQLSSDVNIAYIDVNSLFNQVINNPEKFGFTNVTNSCLSNASICDRPNEYLFWDGIHPTTAAHKLFVELAFADVESAPKPVDVSGSKTTVTLGAMGFAALVGGLILKRIQVQRRRLG